MGQVRCSYKRPMLSRACPPSDPLDRYHVFAAAVQYCGPNKSRCVTSPTLCWEHHVHRPRQTFVLCRLAGCNSMTQSNGLSYALPTSDLSLSIPQLQDLVCSPAIPPIDETLNASDSRFYVDTHPHPPATSWTHPADRHPPPPGPPPNQYQPPQGQPPERAQQWPQSNQYGQQNQYGFPPSQHSLSQGQYGQSQPQGQWGIPQQQQQPWGGGFPPGPGGYGQPQNEWNSQSSGEKDKKNGKDKKGKPDPIDLIALRR